MHGPLTLRRSAARHAIVLTVSGDLDMLNTSRFTAEAADLLYPPTTMVVLDLSQVRLLAAAALTAILAIRDVASSYGIELRLVIPHQAARRSLEITALDAEFTIFDTVEAAAADHDS